MYYLNRRRKKREDEEMNKSASETRCDSVKRAIRVAVASHGMRKTASGLGLLGGGLSSMGSEAVMAALTKKAADGRRRAVRIAVRRAMQKRAGAINGLKNVLRGLGLVGKGVGQVGAGALKPAASAVSTAAGSKLERLARSGRPDLMLEYIRKMRIAQGLFGAGILGGGAALASNVEWD